MNTSLPDGYRASPLLPEYEQKAVDTINAAYRWMNGGDFTTLESLRADWNGPETNRDTDIQVVIAPDGAAAGYIDLWDITALHVRWFSLGYVHPEHMGRGIGSYLLHWVTERARQKMHLAPADARVVLHQGQNSANQAAYELLTANGFQVARNSYRMRIDFDGSLPEPVIPPGITIRPIVPGKEERLGSLAAYESFRDHWGSVEEPFEEYHKRWMYSLENDPRYDPSLWFIALDREEVTGTSFCWPGIEEDPGAGWVGTLGVRRPWRKRGIGLALLQHSFAEFARRGFRRAGLGVDAQNLTGALRLYEKVGMRVARQNSTYEFELRPGKDYLTQSLSSD